MVINYQKKLGISTVAVTEFFLIFNLSFLKITISSKSSVQNINNSASHWSESYATKLKNSKNVSPLKKLLFMRHKFQDKLE